MSRRISSSRPTRGSSIPCFASSVTSVQKRSKALSSSSGCCARCLGPLQCLLWLFGIRTFRKKLRTKEEFEALPPKINVKSSNLVAAEDTYSDEL